MQKRTDYQGHSPMSTIVLIEDNEINANLILRILTPFGHIIHHAKDAYSGLKMVYDVRPDMVLLDFGLPDLDGKVVANRLRHISKTSNVPIIAVTADASPVTYRLALAYGCKEVITKPLDVTNFIDTVQKHLQPSSRLAF
jgi:CheY-like chemotaxis protein